MIKSFRSQAAEDLFHGVASKKALSIPKTIWGVAQRKLDMLNAAHELADIKIPPGNRLERLDGQWVGYHSIRVNDQFRIVFICLDHDAKNVDIVDYH